MAAPSPITNPSRRRSNGREARVGSSLRRDRAVSKTETGHAQRVDHAVGAAREHDVGIAAPNDLGRFPHRLTAGRTGRQAIEIGSPGIEHGGHVPGRHVRFLLQFRGRIEQFESPLDESFAGQTGRRPARRPSCRRTKRSPGSPRRCPGTRRTVPDPGRRSRGRPRIAPPAGRLRRRNACAGRGSSRPRDPRRCCDTSQFFTSAEILVGKVDASKMVV